jgi:hypothetical protein
LYSAAKKVNPRDSKQQFKGYPIFYTSNKYTISSSKAGKPEAKGKTKTVECGTKIIDENGEKVIRIHRLKPEDIDEKLKTNFNSVRTAYPQLATEQMSINDLITKVFPGNMKQKVVVRNETFMGNQDNPIRRVEIYNKNSSYLKHMGFALDWRELPERKASRIIVENLLI